MIGDRERRLQAGMDDHNTSEWTDSKFFTLRADVCAEPLRRSDLMNSINKLAGERSKNRKKLAAHAAVAESLLR